MHKELKADVEVSYKNPLTGLDEVYSFELPVSVAFKYIAKTLNWSLLILILLVALLVWNIMKRNRRLDQLEYETHHLEDEIHALEHARSLLKNKIPKKPSSSPKQESAKKSTLEKKPSVTKPIAKKSAASTTKESENTKSKASIEKKKSVVKKPIAKKSEKKM